MNLSSTYLGLNLPHPFVAGASPLMDQTDAIRRLEEAGAAAIVLRSLFSEQLAHEQEGCTAFVESYEDTYGEATSYFPGTARFAIGPERYLEHLARVKDLVRIPVIGSLNGTDRGSWTEFAAEIEKAGADALELNLYLHPDSFVETGAEIEARCLEIIADVRSVTSIPLAAKLSPFFSSIPNFARRAVEAGADGLVLFNRYYQPKIDIDNLEIEPSLELSTPAELPLRLRWISLIHKRLECSLAVSGGVHRVEDAVQALMAGADVVQLVSVLLREGPGALRALRAGLEHWLEEKEYDSLAQLRGSMSYINSPEPARIERSNYIKILQGWSTADSPAWAAVR